MTRNDTDDTVAEYLAEVAKLVGDLPAIQRRELLTDLETHIAAERIDRNAGSPAEVLDILSRLGSPEVIAAAAREEAPAFTAPGAAAPVPAVPATRRRRVISVAAVLVGLAVLTLLTVATVALFFLSAPESSEPALILPVPSPSR